MADKIQRPLSPHLQIYKWQLTMVMSIFHRFTGAALIGGLALVAWLLIAAATGPEAYALVMAFSRSLVGQIMLFGWTVALYYHSFNGIRHLIWDMGFLFKIKNSYKAGYLVLLLTLFCSLLTWGAIL